MKTKLILFLITIFSASSFIGNAQNVMSLEQCINHARKNNLSVKQSELNLEVTERMKNMQFGSFLPSVNAGASYSYNKGFAIDPTSNQIQPAVKSMVMNVSAQWDIFTGLRNVNNYRKAKFDLLASKYNLEQLKDDISLQVADAYLQIILQKEFLKVAIQQVETSSAEVDRITKLVESGARPKGDLYEAESTFANDEQQLVSVENNLLLAKLNLTQLLQIEFSEDFDIADAEFPMPSIEMLASDQTKIYEEALESQNSIKGQEEKIHSAESDYKSSIGGFMPTLSLVYSFSSRFTFDRLNYAYVPTGTFPVIGTDSNGGNVTSIAPGMQTVTSDYAIMDQILDNKNHYIGLNLSIPIFNKLQTSNNVKIKKLQLENAKTELEIQKNRIRQNVEKAFADAQASLKTYNASEKALNSFEEAFQYAKQKKEVGMISEYDYNSSRTRLISAQSTMIRAKYDFIFKLKVLEYYRGNRFGIEETE